MAGDSEPREIRLEGAGLAAAALALAVLLGGAFWLGRAVERRAPGPPEASNGGPRETAVAEAPVDVSASQDYFDRADRPGQELEPSREATARRPAGGAEPPTTAPTPGTGAFLVQVWAGRDRPTGERLVAGLQAAGYGVRMYAETSGGDTLYKVRIGGYETEARAREAMEELKARGYRGAWIPPTP